MDALGIHTTETGHELPYIDAGGQRRILAARPPSAGQRRPMLLRKAVPLIDRKDWEPCDYSNFYAPVLDQGQQGSCFPPGTRIRMADGSERRIEELRLLDRVVTAEGNLGLVTQLMVRVETDSLYRVHLWGHQHLRVTGEHPILTRRGYVPASELQFNDWVAMPRFLPTSHKSAETAVFIQTAEHVPMTGKTVRQERRVRYAGVSGRRALLANYTPLPDIVNLTPGVGRILGLFLSEGNTDSSKVVWTFNIDETETLAKELAELLTSEWGLQPNVRQTGNRSTVKVTIYGKVWAKLFESLCATGSGNKRLHPDLASGPENFLQALLEGWLAGDGYERRKEHTGVTVSHDLAINMFDIAQALGLRPAIRYSEPKASHNVKSRLPRWDVSLASSGDNYRVELDDTHAWRKVRGVTKEDYSGPVYNFSVEGDESYVAEGIGVHNCVGHGGETSYQRCWSMASGTPRDFSACFLYGCINHNQDNGANITDAMNQLIKGGICLLSTVPEGMIFRRQFPAGADAEAARFKLKLAYTCDDFDAIGTALMLAYILSLSVCVGNNFNSLTSEGVCGVTQGHAGNHCVEAHGLVKLKNGKWGIRIQNSWGTGWGIDGCAVLIESHITPQPYFEAYAVQATGSDPEDPMKPPVAQ